MDNLEQDTYYKRMVEKVLVKKFEKELEVWKKIEDKDERLAAAQRFFYEEENQPIAACINDLDARLRKLEELIKEK
jgi:murein L,D-transpeptidase YafK